MHFPGSAQREPPPTGSLNLYARVSPCNCRVVVTCLHPAEVTVRLFHRPVLIATLTTAVLALPACGSGTPAGEDGITLTITANAISGGKNAAAAEWIKQWVIPRFEAAQKAAGREVRVLFQPNGVCDEQYKTKVALDLKSRTGADVIDLDGIWVGEF